MTLYIYIAKKSLKSLDSKDKRASSTDHPLVSERKMGPLCAQVFIVFTVTSFIQGATYNDVLKLHNDLFRNYNPYIRPVTNQDRTVLVNMSVNIFALQDLDEVSGTLHLSALLKLKWYDEILTWNPAPYGDITSFTIPQPNAWNPDIVIHNSVNGVDIIGNPDMQLRITSLGFVIMELATEIKTSCNIDIDRFPFDTQICSVIFISTTYQSRELSLISENLDVRVSNNSGNLQWNIVNTTLSCSIKVLSSCVLEITLSRKSVYFVYTVLLPILFMIVVNPLVLILPYQSGERTSLSITILLAFAVFMTLVTSTMPRSLSKLSSLIFTTMVFSTAILLINIVILRLYHKEETDPVPKYLQWMLTKVTCKCKNKSVRSRKVDVQKEHNNTQKDVREMNECWCKEEENITWQQVGKELDCLFTIFSIMAIVIVTASFMVALCL